MRTVKRLSLQMASMDIEETQDLQEFLVLLNQKNKFEYVVFDMDSLDFNQFKRVYQLIYRHQVPCLIIGEDTSILHQLSHDFDCKLLTYLPKAILESMYTDSVLKLIRKNSSLNQFKSRVQSFSLQKKPKGLVPLALLLASEPLMKILYLKFSTGFSWDTIIRVITSIEGVMANFEFWFLFPLAAYALFSIRSWSFAFFTLLQAYALVSYFTYQQFTWPHVSETPHISTSFLLFLNSLLVGYFLTPENRRPYWNKMCQLWRDSSRFATKIPTTLNAHEQTTITNISKTGAYLTSDQSINVGDNMQLTMSMGSRDIQVNAKVRRTQSTAHEAYQGYGVEFVKLEKEERDFIHNYISGLQHRIQ